MTQRNTEDPAPGYVLDASALLALLQREPGADALEPLLDRSVISSVNWSEVVQRGLSRGVQDEGLRGDLEALGVRILPFGAAEAEATARLWSATREAGLSLGDRACLSLAQALGLPALTADRGWVAVDVGVEVRLIR